MGKKIIFGIEKMTMLFDLQGKTAIITGASSGLGEQFAHCLSGAGARVILAARRIDKLNTLAAELNNAKAIQMDVSDKQSVKSCFSELEQAGEKIDICVNNAGIAILTPIFEEDDQNNFESIIQTNLMGVWYVTKAAANHMKNHGIHGSIINIASINGDAFPYKEATAYATSKAAVIHMSKALVTELSQYKIRINSIAPGLFHTPMTDHKLGTDQQQQEFARQIPLGFIATPKDLDGTLLLLASNAHSSYMTGTCLTIDGGMSWGGKSW
jgi:NAD(P)-dependent dehydrogenase (short-subunit alcohol dehydrogenase family)